MTLVSRKKYITPCEANYFLYIGFLCLSLKPDQTQILKQSTEFECLLRLYVKLRTLIMGNYNNNKRAM